MNMEERHYLSEPRPIRGLALPTWDVDVLREGVDVPILTLRVDATNLPPRMRKKKVVWKLPDSVEQSPKFGKEDKLRILELFKQHKKTLKREKRKSQPGSNSSLPSFLDEQDSEEFQNESLSLSLSLSLSNSKKPPPAKATDEELLREHGDTTTKKKKNGAKISSSLSSSSSSPPPPPPPPPPSHVKNPPGFEHLSLEKRKPSEAASQPPQPANGQHTVVQPTTNNSQERAPYLSPPPGIVLEQGPQSWSSSSGTTPLSSPPPPGMGQPSSSHGPPPPGIPYPTTNDRATTAAAAGGNGGNGGSAPSTREFTPGPRRYFQLPTPPPGSETLPVNLAHVVTQSYYVMLTHGHIHELQSYYTSSATKSLTVGGAHAICHSSQDVEVQLESLMGMVVAIRGVLQQSIPHPNADAATSTNNASNASTTRTDGSGSRSSILVVITGMCVRPHALPFCHSIVLVPAILPPSSNGGGGAQHTTTTSIGYQIQNDALCFLTTEAPSSGSAMNGPFPGPL